jgi:hypothetical protein
VKFFEKARGEVPPKAQRIYANVFSAATARYISWEIDIALDSRPADFEFQLEVVWYGPAGFSTRQTVDPSQVKKDWIGITVASWGVGSNNTNAWKPGTYRVDFFVNQKKIASNTFEIR